MSISKQEFDHISKLARLELFDDEKDKIHDQISNVLGHFHDLQKVDVTDVDPCAQVSGLLNVWRSDEVENEDSDQALRQSKYFDNGFIKTSKAIEN